MHLLGAINFCPPASAIEAVSWLEGKLCTLICADTVITVLLCTHRMPVNRSWLRQSCMSKCRLCGLSHLPLGYVAVCAFVMSVTDSLSELAGGSTSSV